MNTAEAKPAPIGVRGKDIDKLLAMVVKLSDSQTYPAVIMSAYTMTSLLHALRDGNRSEALLELHNLFDQAWQQIEENGNSLGLASEKPMPKA